MRRLIAQTIWKNLLLLLPLCFVGCIVMGFAPPAAHAQIVTTYSAGAPGDPFNGPSNLVFDKAGNLFVSDKGNHRVQRIDGQTKAVTTVAGTATTAGYAGDGGPATQAQLNCPSGIAFDPSGNLYITDPCQNVVRKVAAGADSLVTGASDEIITTFAGNGTTDACAWTNGVPATQTAVDRPYDVAIDKGGNVFILANDCNDLVRRVDAGSGLISTPPNFYTGYTNGANSFVFDPSGNLLISYFGQIEMCSPSGGPYLTGNEICTLVVGGGQFISPLPRAIDKAGNLYFTDNTCDCSNADLQIFKVTPGPNGTIDGSSVIAQFAGSGVPGYSGDGGPALAASFHGPRGMATDDAGNLYIADIGNNVIRMVGGAPTPPVLNTFPANPTNQTTATFTFSNSDTSVTNFVCTLDGVAGACISPVSYPGLGDGSHTFSVIGKTATGAVTTSAAYTWVVDTVPPPVPSIDSHPANPSNTSNATFVVSDAEAGVSLRCGLEGSLGFCAATTSFTGLTDGAHTFSVIALDAAGNASAPNAFGWTIATTPPPAPQINSAPPALVNQNTASFLFSDGQTGVTFACQLDGAPAGPCVSPVLYVGLADGTHAFSVVANDPVSGRSSAATAYSWTVDTTGPQVGFLGGPATVVIPDPAIVYQHSGSNDIVSFECSLNGAPYSACTFPATYNISTPGGQTLAVRATDAAGNVGDPSYIGWKVTYCRCQAPGDYVNPAFGAFNINSAASSNGEFKMSFPGPGQTGPVQLVRASGGAVMYTLPSTAQGWQFSPDNTRFVFLSSLPYPNSPVDATVLDLTTSTATRILIISNVGNPAILQFSPTGAYLMVAGVRSSTQNYISVYRVGDVSVGVNVYSTDYLPFSGGEFGVATWGFSASAYGEPEASFLFAYVSGQNTVTWNVANLAAGRQSISQTTVLGSGYWQFDPCGTKIALVSQPFANSEQVDLFSTETGQHLGETSFPLQPFTISSTVAQEVANITNPQQTLVITNNNCGANTTVGNNVSVAPTCANNTSPASVTFSSVTQEGGTGVTESSTGNAPPGNFQVGNPPVYYDISTSATYSGDITICINYAGITFSGPPALFHFENGAWVDRTTSLDTVTQTVCGTVSSLSPFALFSQPVTTAPAITSAASTTFLAGSAGGFTVLTTGTPKPALTESGALPAGVSFVDNHDGSAVLTGTPTAGGTFNFSIAANNSGGTATQNFVLTVNGGPAITSANSATFTVGTLKSFTVAASGFPAPTLSETGTLPSGVTFDATTGTLSGTASSGTGGTYALSFGATNGVGTDAVQSFTLTVNEAPAITSSNSATFSLGAVGAFQMTAAGFPAPTFGETGALPTGVSFNPATGTLSGTPSASGVFKLTLAAQNGVGGGASQAFTLTVTQAPAITSANSVAFTAGTAGSFTVTTSGFPPPVIAENGTLPAGVVFTDNGNGTGTLSGIAASAGTFPISFTASNGAGSAATQNFSLIVSPANNGPIASITPTSIDFGNVVLRQFALSKATLTNTGTSNLVISGISIVPGPGTERETFPFLSLCKSPLAPGKSCVIYVSFFASQLGASTATLNIRDNASNSPQKVTLKGTAVRKSY